MGTRLRFEEAVPELHRESRSYRTFGLAIALVVAIFLCAVFLGMALSNRSLMRRALLEQARGAFQNIVTTRKWNASYGGVYVEKRPGMQSNPYLKHPDITATDGKVYTKKNPALMTREISEMERQAGSNQFHIASLRPLNPANKPDAIEAKALRAFEKGAKERYWTQVIGGREYFRYMAPLVTEESCLQCHRDQGYRVGDIRGGISVEIDTQGLDRQLRRNSLAIPALDVATTALLLALIFGLFRRLRRQLTETRRLLQLMATMDPLTGAYNRGHIQQRLSDELSRHSRHRQPLSCTLLDIDHFKSVNDTYGHQVGDQVLKQVTGRIARSLRPYDIVGRYGGEEFLVILPEAGREAAVGISERLREAVAEQVTVAGADGRCITVSAGLAFARPDDTVDALTQRADEALYRAKSNGRNRVEVSE